MRLLKVHVLLAIVLAAQMVHLAQIQQSQTPVQPEQKANPVPQVIRDSGHASETTNVSAFSIDEYRGMDSVFLNARMGVAATPIGVTTFGGSVGDAGRRKICFA